MKFGIVHHSMGHDIPLPKAMEAAAQAGAFHLATGVNANNRDEAKDLAAQHGLDLVTGWGAKYIELGDAVPTEPFEAFCRDVLDPLDIRVVGTCSSHHRWH
ncbi:MAG: hypothetical protein O3A46_15295, partial [Candidatus Poribacteria bacterium]|nr:hypothetical protein [Candidatus Poribacteria bacterium]